MTRVSALVLALVLGLTTPAVALTTYYVAPNSTTAHTGAAATPWISLDSSAWSTINATLATDDVTVYFSARNATSDSNTQSTVPIALDRRDGSTHRLTLDGISQYNTDNTSPSWVPHITPSPSSYKSASKFQITSSYPINSNNGSAPYPDRNYITIRGFRLISTEGQIINCTGCNNLIIEYNEGSHTGTPTTGPAVSTGVPFADNLGNSGGTWSSHVIIRYNFIHDTQGECIYIGASTPDPPGVAPGKPTGTDILIQGNTITDCGRLGGEGDGIDVKDGNSNLRVINNVITYPHLNPATGLYDTGQSCGCNGISEFESGTLIDGNYIEAPRFSGIATGAAWNTIYRGGPLTIRNNIIVHIWGGSGIDLGQANSSTYQWSGTKVYNNTIYNVAADGIAMRSPQSNVTVQNNIIHTTAGNGINSSTAGLLATHDYNIFFVITRDALANAGTNTTCANIATAEAHSLCADPKFINTGTPYAAANFRLQATSPAIVAALNLSSTFTDDYGGNTRTLWDVGAWAFIVGTGPAPPTQLRVSRLRFHPRQLCSPSSVGWQGSSCLVTIQLDSTKKCLSCPSTGATGRPKRWSREPSHGPSAGC